MQGLLVLLNNGCGIKVKQRRIAAQKTMDVSGAGQLIELALLNRQQISFPNAQMLGYISQIIAERLPPLTKHSTDFQLRRFGGGFLRSAILIAAEERGFSFLLAHVLTMLFCE